jgi:hypothetical protein
MKYANLDQCSDKMSFPFGRFGESGSNLTAQMMRKPGLSKGGQIILLSADVGRNRVRAYTHKHKVYDHPPGFTCKGPAEARQIMEIIQPLVIGEESLEIDTKRQIFKEKPHLTLDNYFSGDHIMDWAGENGFSATMTCQHDRLPGGITDKYFHKESIQNGNKHARVRQFNNPITLVKTVLVILAVGEQIVEADQKPTAAGDASDESDASVTPIPKPVMYMHACACLIPIDVLDPYISTLNKCR